MSTTAYFLPVHSASVPITTPCSMSQREHLNLLARYLLGQASYQAEGNSENEDEAEPSRQLEEGCSSASREFASDKGFFSEEHPSNSEHPPFHPSKKLHPFNNGVRLLQDRSFPLPYTPTAFSGSAHYHTHPGGGKPTALALAASLNVATFIFAVAANLVLVVTFNSLFASPGIKASSNASVTAAQACWLFKPQG
ncbi:hypothetical protein FA15DRAFT_711798 [Coprinopsis marcescibilis]|uniref:Uncharacterized protein n=1 Tax=Coprinopsis marcescibilis TaxID=230819 RepID=A0A5C3K9C2_COPMA|nr:hypothetical protein FA15DRAFT_711798 [Coprinopsis marcescibilis]